MRSTELLCASNVAWRVCGSLSGNIARRESILRFGGLELDGWTW